MRPADPIREYGSNCVLGGQGSSKKFVPESLVGLACVSQCFMRKVEFQLFFANPCHTTLHLYLLISP